MASSKIPVVSFTGGEVDSKTLTQVNLDVAPQTAETMENLYLFTDGGMSLRPGTKYIGTAPGKVILRPWSFSQDLSFALEIGAGAMRFIFDEGYITLTGAAATIGTFTNSSGSPPSGGDPAPGESDVTLTVTVTDAFWEPVFGGYEARGYYVASGGSGAYVTPAVVTIVTGSVTSSVADGGLFVLASATNDPATLTITVTDTDAASGTSASALVTSMI